MEAAGRRQLQRLLLTIGILTFCALGSLAIYAVFAQPPGPHLYLEHQRRASIIYLLIWLAVAALAIFTGTRRRSVFFSLFLLLLLALEGASHIYFFHANGRPYIPQSRVLLDKFQPHPLLVGIPRPGVFEGVSHDNRNRRTTVNEGKVEHPKLIYLFGGSTTYDIANPDSQTWASDLSRRLGAQYEVQNYGAPGYTSLESMIQSLFAFRDKRPICAVYYMGWNDLANAHIENLKSDYSDVHLPNQVGLLGVGHRPGFVENNWLLLRIVLSLFREGPKADIHGKASGDIDPRLARIFSENMALIADIDRHFAVKSIFLPQVMNYEWMAAHYSSGWFPFVPAGDLRSLMKWMHSQLAQTAQESGAVYLAAPLSANWTEADFVDEGHFSVAGADKFASLLAEGIAANCQ